MPPDGRGAPPDIRCVALSKTYPVRGGILGAVDPLDIVFEPGRTTALLGPSGCGKSTILRMLAGLEAPTTGEVWIGGASPDDVRRRAGLAVAFQEASLLPWRSVRGNVALALTLARRPADPARVDRLIALVGLEGFEERHPAELSGGMRQRAAIARCLVTEPDLLLLDEPFGSVDELTRLRLNFDLPRLWEGRGATAILVTHSVSEAVLLADRALVLSHRPARIVADIPLPLSRPRAPETTRSAAFHDLVDQVSAALSGVETERDGRLAAE